ncbi:MAG: acylphosphatase [Pseudomonadota bacterium]|nr:acylphosphatase [Pseudomonadota bacterium]
MSHTVRAVIKGRVQGVGYRSWAIGTASELRLQGWVRNRSDGTVEAVFSGEGEQVSAMLEACWEGPILAQVENVETSEWGEAPEEGFVALPTA